MRKKTTGQDNAAPTASEDGGDSTSAPANWPEGAIPNPTAKVTWLPEGWSCAKKETSGGKLAGCFISPTGKLCWRKEQVEKIVGKTLGTEDGAPKPAGPPAKRLRTSGGKAETEEEPPTESVQSALARLDSFGLESASSVEVFPTQQKPASAPNSATVVPAAPKSTPAASNAPAAKKGLMGCFAKTPAAPQTKEALQNSEREADSPKTPEAGAPRPTTQATGSAQKSVEPSASSKASSYKYLDTTVLPKAAQDQFFKALDKLDAMAFNGTVAPRTVGFSLTA